ncbi:MAG: Tol-Pal system beta propeller repeat protein TolB, partial [Phenylobacterium sp.]
MPIRALALALATLTAAVAAPGAQAQGVQIDVNRANVQPLPIAIPVFAGGQLGADISSVITGDLQRSGLFRPLPPSSFIQRDLSVAVVPAFADWKAINAQALVSGQVINEGGRLRVQFRLWNVYGEQPVGEGVEFSATPENWRRVAHKVSDAIYERLTGEKGYFDTRVVFVAESGGRTNRVKRLAIMDQDGANPEYLTDGSYIVLSPRFSSTSQEITYMSLRPEGTAIWLFNLESGRRESLGQFPGMVYAPRFSPDGSRVAFSVERGGNSDVYVMDLRSRASRRLTTDPSIDTSPSFSPDGSRIVFNSDRGGSPQLYVMNADGSGARRISFGSGRYTTPVWSPIGDLIAFT